MHLIAPDGEIAAEYSDSWTPFDAAQDALQHGFIPNCLAVFPAATMVRGTYVVIGVMPDTIQATGHLLRTRP